MYALLYRSRAQPGLLADDLNGIIETAEVRNRQRDVTGLLLHGRMEALPGVAGEFVQWLEGPEEAVESLFDLIEQDDRHTGIEILGRGPLADLAAEARMGTREERLFPYWSLGLVRLSELPATLSGFFRFVEEWEGGRLAAVA